MLFSRFITLSALAVASLLATASAAPIPHRTSLKVRADDDNGNPPVTSEEEATISTPGKSIQSINLVSLALSYLPAHLQTELSEEEQTATLEHIKNVMDPETTDETAKALINIVRLGASRLPPHQTLNEEEKSAMISSLSTYAMGLVSKFLPEGLSLGNAV